MQASARLSAGTSARLSAGVFLSVYDQFQGLSHHTMFAAAGPAQHFLVAPMERSRYTDLLFLRVSRARMAGFGRIHIIAVTGDAAQVHLLERLVQVR
ncbi:MAG: hypothetical protein M5U34_46110 [Chloroflexi bacterium]|nr:hypothetical protein [Chloroflexota bacterium]